MGGALAGWIGGKGYGEKRKSREDRRDKTQYDWEERFGRPHGFEKERARGEYPLPPQPYEKDGYERRRSYDDRDRRREKY